MSVAFDLTALTPEEFVGTCLCLAQSEFPGATIRLLDGPGDGGHDIRVEESDRTISIQCKRYSHAITVGQVLEALFVMVNDARAHGRALPDEVIFAVSSRLTTPAAVLVGDTDALVDALERHVCAHRSDRADREGTLALVREWRPRVTDWNQFSLSQRIARDPYLSMVVETTSTRSATLPARPTLVATTAALRRSLEPRVLPRVARSRVVARCREVLMRPSDRARSAGRMLMLVGPAGCGKSTVLGQLHDELADELYASRLIIRCSDVVMPRRDPSDLDIGFGLATSGVEVPLRRLLLSLAPAGRTLLLVDTLDIMIHDTPLSALQSVLRAVLCMAVDVVITCRDFEFDMFLAPTRERVPLLHDLLERQSVGLFDEDEARAAATAYLRRMGSQTTSEGKTTYFLSRLESICDERRRLAEVLRHPLMLALTCEVFGPAGALPDDLTASAVYDKYWNDKVRADRHGHMYTAAAVSKEALCAFACALVFARSEGRLVDHIHAADLAVANSSSRTTGLGQLLSEGILRETVGGRVYFFHQTFLEYAIARWLLGNDGERESFLAQGIAGHNPPHWWPVLRHLLLLLDDADFLAAISRADTTQLQVFRLVVTVLASRGHLGRLEEVAVAQTG